MRKGIVVGVAAALALVTAGVYEAASTVAAPGPAQDPGMPAGTQNQNLSAPQTAAIGSSDPLAIREAHSDGGYWYWEKR